MIIRALAALTLSCLAISATAAVINANDFIGGTNFAHPDDNTTLTHVYDSYTGPRINYSEEAIIKELPAVTSYSYFGSENTTLSTQRSFVTSHHPSTNLDDMLTQPGVFGGNYAMFLLSYVDPTRQFGFKGFENGGDGFRVLTFDINKNLIKTYSLSDNESKQEIYHGSLKTVFHYNHTISFAHDAYYVLFGGHDTHTFIYEINTSVPEPSILVLLTLALLTLGLRNQRRNRG